MSEVQHISSLGFDLNPAKQALDGFITDFTAFEQKIIAEGKTIKQALESVLKDGIGGFKGGESIGQQSFFGNTSAAKDNIRKSTKELEKEYVDDLKRMGMGVKKAHEELFANGNLGAGLIDYFKGNGQKTAMAWTREFQSHFNETNLRKIMSPFIAWNADGAAAPDKFSTDLQERFPELAQYSNVVDMWERIREAMERYYAQRKALVAGDDARAELVRYREELQNTDEMYRKVAANFDSKIGEVRSGAGIGKELYSQGDLEAMAAKIQEAAGYQTKLTVETNEAGEATRATLTYVDQLNNQYREMWRYVQEVDAETGDVSEGFQKINASATQSVEATKRISEQFNRLYGQMQSDVAKQTTFFTSAGDEGSVAMLKIIEQHMATIKGSGKEITRDQLERLQGLRQEQLVMRDVMAGAKEQEAAKKAEKAATLETVAAYKQTYDLEAKMQKLKMTDTAAYEQVGNMKQQVNALYQKLQIGEKITAEEREQVDVMRQQLSVINGQVSAEKSVQGAATTPVQGGLLARAGQWFGAYQAWHLTVRAGRELISTMTDVETRMMEVNRVMGNTEAQGNRLRDSIFDIAGDMGREFDTASEIMLRFAQAGYDVAESTEMTRTAILAMNTAELDAANSTNSMIGILQQWGYEASDLATVIDKLNYTADNNAITTQDLVDGLLRSSSAAKNAKFSFEETIGTLVALREATGRTGRELGTALNSLISFTQRQQSRNVFESMGVAIYADEARTQLRPLLDVWQDLSALVKSGGQDMVDALSKMDGAMELVTEDMAEMVGMEEEYQDLFKKGMSDTDMEAVYNQASTFRRNYWIALLENFGEIQKVVGEMDNAIGHSERENARYMETLEAKYRQLVTSLQQLAVQAADSGLMDFSKFLLDAANALLKLTKATGGVIPVLGLLITVVINLRRQTQLLAVDTTATAAAQTAAAATATKSAAALTALKTAFTAAGGGVKGFGAALYTALGPVGLVIIAVQAAKGLFDLLTTSAAEQQEQLEEAASAYDEAKTSLESLTAELENARDRMKELTEQGTLDLVEAEELAELRETTAELEKQLLIKEKIAQRAAEELAKEAADTYEQTFGRGATFSAEQVEDYQRSANATGNNAILLANERDINALIAAYRQFYELREEAVTNQDIEMEQHFAGILKEIEGLLTDNISDLQAYKDAVRDIPYEEMAPDVQRYWDEATRGIEMALGIVDPDKLRSINFKDVFNAEQFQELREGLIGLATQGKLTQEALSGEEYAGIMSAFEAVGLSAGDVCIVLEELYGLTAEGSEGLSYFQEAATSAAEELKALSSNLKTLESAMRTVADGEYLSLDAVLALIDACPELANAIEHTADGFSVQEGAMYRAEQAIYAKMAADYAAQWAVLASADANEKERAVIGELVAVLQSASTAAQKQAAINEILAQSGYNAAAGGEAQAAAWLKVNAVLAGTPTPGVRTRSVGGGGGGGQDPRIKELQDLQREVEKSYKAQEDAVRKRYDAEIDALKRLKEENSRRDDRADYEKSREELLAEKADLEKRTSREAVARLKEIEKELARLDEEERRRQRDNALDDQIADIEAKRDAELEAIRAAAEAAKESYQAQIAGMQAAASAAGGASKKITEYLINDTYRTKEEVIKWFNEMYDAATKDGSIWAQTQLANNAAVLASITELAQYMDLVYQYQGLIREGRIPGTTHYTPITGPKPPGYATGGYVAEAGPMGVMANLHRGEIIVRKDISDGLLRVIEFMNSSLMQQAGYARRNYPAPAATPTQVIIQGPLQNIERQEIADHADARRGAADAGDLLLREVEKLS